VIYGPATANYDIDLGAMPITDWYHQTAFQEDEIAARGAPPAADNGLINGTMVNPTGTGGAYNTITLTKGKKYRLRLINTSLDNHFKVSLDGHNLTVIQADFVPIVPYSTQWLFIGIGQRYDVIITANQAISSYWFRADVQQACGANNNNFNIKAIFNYASAAAGNPTTIGATYTQSCTDETQIVPYVKKDVPSADFITHVQQLNVTLNGGGIPGSNGNIVTWTINGTPLNIDWELPTLKYVQESNDSFPVNLNLIKLPNANEVYATYSH
jgi:FtsP/CotA-like multicopper oxidase with cupredoxin domain